MIEIEKPIKEQNIEQKKQKKACNNSVQQAWSQSWGTTQDCM